MPKPGIALSLWIDLNAPCNGTWKETTRIPGNKQPERRRELRKLYGGIDEDGEDIEPASMATAIEFVNPIQTPKISQMPTLAGWPLNAAKAKQRQAEAQPWAKTIDIGNGLKVELVRIPAGSFVMGAVGGDDDETPHQVALQSFWIGKLEISNEQYAQFDPEHDSRFEDRTSWIFSEAYLGWPLNRPQQPVVRVSWLKAMEFCKMAFTEDGAKSHTPNREPVGIRLPGWIGKLVQFWHFE